MACALLGLECEVWQVRASFDSKPYRRYQMEVYGGTCHPSPSDLTEAGRAMLEQFPDTTGSLGMAISEAVEVAAKDPQADRKSTRLNSSHVAISYAVFCLKKKKNR